MKLNNLSFRSKLLFVILPFIGLIFVLLFFTSAFIKDFANQVTVLANQELQNQMTQTLVSEAKDIFIEYNTLLYQGKDALLKFEQKEDLPADNYLTQLEVLSGKFSTITGQLISLQKKAKADQISADFAKLSVDLKKWGTDINEKKVDFTHAAEDLKQKRKLLKSFIKDNLTFEEGKSNITSEILAFVTKAQSKFSSVRILFIFLIVLTSIFSAYLLINMTKSLTLVISDLKIRFKNLNRMSQTISDQSNELSVATQEQTASLQETAATMEEITATIRNNSSIASASKDEVLDNSRLTSEGTDYLKDMIISIDNVKSVNEQLPIDMAGNIEDMNKIVNVIQDIQSKTRVINDIVFQTKLLSFNASVEAARAGENGKGFSVVAEEIGKLAQMSGDAAKEISDLLGESTKVVSDTINNNKNQITESVSKITITAQSSYEKASGCNEILQKISAKAISLNQMIDSISQSSDEQANGAGQINIALSQLDQVSNKNYLISTEVSKSGEELKENAHELELTINKLDHFLVGTKVS